VGYQSDMRRFAPDAQLAAVVPDWSGHYIRAAQAVMDERWQPHPVWGGMKDGMVQLVAVDPALPAELRRLVEARRAAIVAGSFKPFSAPLKDNAGTLHLAQGTLDDAAIATMNWLVEGVAGTLPGQ